MSSEYLKSVHWDLDVMHPDGCAIKSFGINNSYKKLCLKNKYSDDRIIIYHCGDYDFAETPWGDMDIKSFNLNLGFKHSTWNCGCGLLRKLTEEELKLEIPEPKVEIEFY